MRTRASFLTLAASLCLVPLAHAAEPAPKAAIRSMIGKWSGSGTLESEGKTHKVAMTWDCVESSGAAGVRCKAQIKGIPGFVYQFDDLWGYSAADNLVHWYTVTNAGEVHDHRGHFDANGGQLSADVAMDGRVLSEVITFKRRNKNLSMTWICTFGGALKEKGAVELTRK